MAKVMCSCGHPQSYPIPHEHDRTDREKEIIAFYKSIIWETNQKSLKVVIKMIESSNYQLVKRLKAELSNIS